MSAADICSRMVQHSIVDLMRKEGLDESVDED